MVEVVEEREDLPEGGLDGEEEEGEAAPDPQGGSKDSPPAHSRECDPNESADSSASHARALALAAARAVATMVSTVSALIPGRWKWSWQGMASKEVDPLISL